MFTMFTRYSVKLRHFAFLQLHVNTPYILGRLSRLHINIQNKSSEATQNDIQQSKTNTANQERKENRLTTDNLLIRSKKKINLF